MAENIKIEQHYYTRDSSGYRNEEDSPVTDQKLTVTITLNEYRKLTEIRAVKDKEEDAYRGRYFAEEKKSGKLEKKNIKLKSETCELQSEESDEKDEKNEEEVDND